MIPKYKRAEDFITNVLGMPIERPRRYGSMSIGLKRYQDGRNAIVLPAQLDINSVEIQEALWHEVGHFIDDAHYYGGRSSKTSWVQVGKYSSKNHALLQENREYLQSDRTPFQIDIQIGKKHYSSLEEVLADPEVSEWAKTDMKTRMIKDKYIQKSYLAQDVEVFADGFAKYLRNPIKMQQDLPGVARMYEQVFAQEQSLTGFHQIGRQIGKHQGVLIGKSKINTSSDIYSVQLHKSTGIAKTHFDIRIGYKGKLISFATKTRLPRRAGQSVFVVRVEDHPLSYALWSGTIAYGKYGQGKVLLDTFGQRNIIEYGPKKIKVEFIGGKYPGVYAFIRMGNGKIWKLIKPKRK
ncbi:MAG: DNA polymerase ligase N-terminal domain-containing protein [bacterium]|nr:DNA polymerase ligase N-terminal domain-containing protein [bacterium]